MNRTALLLVCAAFAVAGCGGSQNTEPRPLVPAAPVPAAVPPPAPAPTAPVVPPPALPESEATEEPEQPVAEPAPSVVCHLPPGWVRIPSSRLHPSLAAVYVAPEKRAQVVVKKVDGSKTLKQHADAMHKVIKDSNKDVKLSKVTAASDGKSSSFTVDAGEVHGKVVVRKLGRDDTYLFIAKWDTPGEKVAAPDADQIISGTRLQNNVDPKKK